MIRLAAILMLFLAVVFDGWAIKHGTFDYRFLFLLGMLFWCISERWDFRA